LTRFSVQHASRKLRALARPGRGALLLTLGLALGAGGYAAASSTVPRGVIRGCVSRKTHQLYVQPLCGRGQRSILWDWASRPEPWALVQANQAGATVEFGSHIATRRVATGEYTITVTAGGACGFGAIAVDPEGAEAGNGTAAVVPTAYANPISTTGNHYDVHIFNLASGVPTPVDTNFGVTITPC
jgi:hypothetical protein